MSGRDTTTPMLPAVAAEYARPPEDAERNTPEPDWMARASRQHEEGWTTGYVEAAVGELAALWRSVQPSGADEGFLVRHHARRHIAARLDELRRRFGDADVDRQLARVPDLRPALEGT